MVVSPPRTPAGTRSGSNLKKVQPGSGRLPRAEERRARREFIAGGAFDAGFYPAGATGRTLPAPFDDLARDFGNDVYAEMAKDPAVSAALIVLKASILEDGLMLSPAIEDQKDKQYKRAVRIRDLAVRMFERLDVPLDQVLWNMLDALHFGAKVAEIVSEWQDVKGEGRKLMVRAIKPKPRSNVAFVVDAYMNLLGVVGAKPGQGLVASNVAPAAAEVVPPDKVMILTNRGEDCDPRGTSVLRAAYEPWWKKRQLAPEYLHYLSQFATPSVWATPPEGQEAAPETDPLGNLVDADGAVIADPDGEDAGLVQAPLTPQEELLAELQLWRNGYALVVPNGTAIHTVEMLGDGAPFLNAFVLWNAEIVKAILTQSLATEEGQHQARAAAQTHQDVLDTLVRQYKKAVEEMIHGQVLVPWVARNWGDDAAEELVPRPSLGTTERQDLPATMTAVAALMRAAYFHSSQLPALDDMLALPTRDLTQTDTLQPAASPAPGEPSAAPGGEMGRGGTDTGDPNPGAPSGPAQRGGRGKQPARQPARRDQS